MDTPIEQQIGEYVLWLEAGNGDNALQSMCAAIAAAAPQWYASKQAYLATKAVDAA